MKRVAVMFMTVVAVFLILSCSRKDGPPHPDALAFGGHWYAVIHDKTSWQKAKEHCEKLGGYLACVESEVEQRFISRLAKGEYLFLGATDEAGEGAWKWVNGASMEYKAWIEGQPNNLNGTEHYLATYDRGQWMDVAAQGDDYWMPVGYVCEWGE